MKRTKTLAGDWGTLWLYYNCVFLCHLPTEKVYSGEASYPERIYILSEVTQPEQPRLIWDKFDPAGTGDRSRG